MSYLNLLNGIPNFSKAVISLWFRVPKASVIAATGHSIKTDVPGFPIMQSIIPLITYGKPQVNKNYQQIITNVAVYHFGGTNPPFMETSGYSENTNYDVDPCFIGLECSDDETFRLVFNIQTGVETSYSSIDWVTTAMHFYDPDLPGPGPFPNYTGSGWLSPHQKADIQDASYIENAQPDWFYVNTGEYFDPDTWHHLLLSFDVSGTVSIGQPFASSICKLWYAVDDKDYRGSGNLQPHRDNGDGLDENVILTRTAYVESSATPADGWLYQNHRVAAPSGTYDGNLIPTSEHPVGLPAAAKYVDAIFRVEMAELQMWTGVTLDTEVESNRRAFIDYQKDEDGNRITPPTMVPVSPDAGATKEDPRGLGEKLLGKRQDVMLHGSGDWQTGYNTGSTGVVVAINPEDGTREFVKIPQGQFTPVAKIVPYTPDPIFEKKPVTAARII